MPLPEHLKPYGTTQGFLDSLFPKATIILSIAFIYSHVRRTVLRVLYV